jgi:trigger factor
MEANRDLELLDNASVRLKITVPEADVRREYDDLVSEYCKKVQIKGFRKGRVPPDVLVRKFGDSIKAETAEKLIQRTLEEALPEVEHKPLPYVRPSLEDEIDLQIGEPFVFQVTYDTFPQVELGAYKELAVEEPQVQIADEDLQRELEQIQKQNGIVVDKAEGAAVASGDTITIDYVEVDEKGEEQEQTKREGFTFTVGSGYNLHKIDDDVVGMTRDEERVLEKEYPEDFEVEDLRGRKLRLKVKVSSIKETQLPDIDDDLAQDVSDEYETLDDLKKAIRQRLEEALSSQLRENKIGQIMEQVVAESKIVYPQAMVERDLQLRWSDFVRRVGGNEELVLGMLRQQQRTPEDLVEEWRPAVETSIKRRVAIQEIAEAEKVVVDDGELEETLGRIAEQQNRDVEEIRGEYRSNGMLEVLRQDRRVDKAYDLLLESAKTRKGKKVGFLDFMQGNG